MRRDRAGELSEASAMCIDERPSLGLLVGVALCLGLTMGAPTPAAAQNNEAMAQTLFEQGRALMAENNHAKACAKFEQSRSLQPRVGTLLNLAVCREKMGMTASAWANFKSAATLAKRAEQSQREAWAREQAERVAATLSYLTVAAPNLPADAALLLDGEPFAIGMVGNPLPIDPGDHVVTASAPNTKSVRVEVNVPAGPVRIDVTLPELEPVAAPQPAARPAPSGDVPLRPDRQPEPVGPSPLVFVGFGVGLAGLAVGSVTGGIALASSSELDNSCQNNMCLPAEHDQLDDARTLSHVSTAAFIVGAAGIGAGIVGILLSDFGATEESATIAPIVAPTYLGLRARF